MDDLSDFDAIIGSLDSNWLSSLENQAEALSEELEHEFGVEIGGEGQISPEVYEMIKVHLATGLVRSMLASASEPDPRTRVREMVSIISNCHDLRCPFYQISPSGDVRQKVSEKLLKEIPSIVQTAFVIGASRIKYLRHITDTENSLSFQKLSEQFEEHSEKERKASSRRGKDRTNISGIKLV